MKITTSLMLVSSLLIAGTVYSHSDATGIVKDRMDAMEDMSDKSKAVADMFKGKLEFDRKALSDAATAFSLHGAQMAELFPDTKESRSAGGTEALARIWDEWDEFSELVNQFAEDSESLKKIVVTTEDEGELKKAFFSTTKSCSSCHKRFRRPKG